MSKYIIIMYTKITRKEEVELVSNCLLAFEDISEWTIDLSDSDNVLRIAAHTEIGSAVHHSLNTAGVKSTLMEVFQN
ncbi:hypothetical protein [Pedobacter rhizosphaerae]|nr:hypothetical protein [Pedobacter rhizosphaerae]